MMSAFDTQPQNSDDESETLHSQRVWKAAGKQDLDFDSQRLRNRLRAKMFGVDASPVTIGRFVVLETVGSGGMGVVYGAYDEELDRRVAVKLLRTSREEDASVGKGRLQREAQALAKLSHPNVVQVYEVGTFDDRVFLAMEFLSGPNLRAWLIDESRPWREVLHHFIEAGEGLAAAHREGIIHRDFKPANVLFGGDGRVRVVDFGLARASEHARIPQPTPSGEFREQALAVELTQTGEIMGTPAYMSPEQARYEGVDARSDQYSFCVALYEALFGRRPHVGSSMTELLISVAEGKVAPPPRNTKVPARIVRAIMRGLSSEPRERFGTMEALLDELSPEQPGRWRVLGGAAIAASAAGLLAYLFIGGTDEPGCPTFDTALDQAWGVEQRASVQSSFAASDAPEAERVAARVSDRLDAYAEQWRDARRDACQAHRVRHEQSAPLHDQRVACLLEREVELSTLVQVFQEDATAEVVGQAPRAVAELSAVAECQDFERMSRAAADTPVREDLRIKLAKARAQYKAGLYEQALAGSVEVGQEARADATPGIEAAAWLQRGLIQERRQADALAATAMEQALDLAEAAGDDELSAHAWSRLARYDVQLERSALAERAMRRAWAKVRRVGEDPQMLLEVRESQALVAWQAGRSEDAIEEQVGVVDQYLEQRGEDDPRTADAERRLANMLGGVGRHEEAQDRYARAREVLVEAYGPGHPQVAHVTLDAAIDHRVAGHPEDAREAFLEAERLFIMALGTEAPPLLAVYKGLADLALGADELDEAQSRVEKLLTLSKGPHASATDRADALALQGQIAASREDHDTAVASYREYLQVTSVGPLRHSYRIHRIASRIGLGDELLALHRYDEAEAQQRRVLTELDRSDDQPLDATLDATLRANAWLGIARCTEQRGELAVDAYENGLRVWSDDASLDPASEGTRSQIRWGLARQLQTTDVARARQLAQSARSGLDPATQQTVDAWLRADDDGS